MTTVADTSVILVLAKISLMHVLRDLYGEVTIPASVAAEALHEAYEESPETTSIRAAVADGWLKVNADTEPDSRLVALGRGERAAIALAISMKAELVLIDDWQGRRIAASIGVPVSGTVAVLARAKRDGLIAREANISDQLRAIGFRVTDEVLRAAGLA